MYVYLHHKDATFTNNSEYIFNIPGGLWLQGEIALAEIQYKIKKGNSNINCLDVCCNVCDTSFVGSQTSPVLRRIHVNKDKRNEHHIFPTLYYVPVSKPWTSNLTVHIKPVHSQNASFELETLNCTLHIKS